MRVSAILLPLVATAMLLPLRAVAEVLMVDVNDQAGERAAVSAAGARWGGADVVEGSDADDLARQLEAVFAQADAGLVDPEVVVLSGHNDTGKDFWSFHQGRGDYYKVHLSLDTLQAIAARHPAAAAKVKHLVLLGCFAGTPDDSEAWQDVFPGVIVVGGFNDIGPSKTAPRYLSEVLGRIADARDAAGGEDKLAQSLDDQKQRTALQRSLDALDAVRNTNWSFRVCGEFYCRKPVTPTIAQQISDAEAGVFVDCLRATDACKNPDARHDDLRTLFRMEMAQGSRVPTAVTRRQRVEGLLHYDDRYLPEWTAAHPQLATPLAAAGVPGGDLTKLSRADQISLANELAASTDPAQRAVGTQLQQEVVLMNWIPDDMKQALPGDVQ